jgi:hypothetical protein
MSKAPPEAYDDDAADRVTRFLLKTTARRLTDVVPRILSAPPETTHFIEGEKPFRGEW